MPVELPGDNFDSIHVDSFVAAKQERMRRNEDERKRRIFDARTRTIGIDRPMLEIQVMDKQIKEAVSNAEDACWAQELTKQDQTQKEYYKQYINKKKAFDRSVQAANRMMASQQTFRIREMNKEYTQGAPTEEYFDQFNTCSR